MKTGREPFIYLAPVLLLVLVVALVPLIFVVYTSFFNNGGSFGAYTALFESKLFRRSLATTFEISAIAAAASLLLGYPIAVHLAGQPPHKRSLYMILVLVPFWTSILVKSYAFTVILGREGIVNEVLSFVVGSRVHIPMLFNRFGVIVGMTNFLIPFVVFPVMASLLSIEPAVYRAAETMGARPPRIFWRITLPLSVPGIVSGVATTFVMSLGFFVIPALLGGRQDVMLANLVDFYTRETLDWNMAAGIGVILLSIVMFVATSLFAVKRAGPAARVA